MSILEVRKLALNISGRQLLENVSFEVEKGTCVAITGPSGSGKTSLVNCLCGITTPSSGTVCVEQVEINQLGLSDRSSFRLRRIGIVFQFGELLPELTALENVALPLRMQGVSRHEAERTAADWLDRLGLGGRSDAHSDELSGGEIQRVAIARASVHQPILVLADEPTGALDEINSSYITELLVDTAKELGSGLIIATHDPLVASKADFVLRLREGHLNPTESARL